MKCILLTSLIQFTNMGLQVCIAFTDQNCWEMKAVEEWRKYAEFFSGIKSIIHINSSFAPSDVCIWSPKPITIAGKFALMLAVTFDVNRVVSLGILMYINGRKFPDKV